MQGTGSQTAGKGIQIRDPTLKLIETTFALYTARCAYVDEHHLRERNHYMGG